MLTKILRPGTEAAYAFLRVVAGLMFSCHGMQKIFGVLAPEHPAPHFPTQEWWGGIIELVCGLAIAFGLLTSWAAFLASGTMAVAYVQFHWAPWDKGWFNGHFFPIVNKGELALLYSVLFLYIACRGGGEASIDGRRSG
ncbi:MAG TPA: DoxX family protein [Planctomycetota bacterium]|nr:DoxX family protein [Planctomycetota bacterium]